MVAIKKKDGGCRANELPPEMAETIDSYVSGREREYGLNIVRVDLAIGSHDGDADVSIVMLGTTEDGGVYRFSVIEDAQTGHNDTGPCDCWACLFVRSGRKELASIVSELILRGPATNVIQLSVADSEESVN